MILEVMESTRHSFEIYRGGLRREIKNSSHRKTANLHVSLLSLPVKASILSYHNSS